MHISKLVPQALKEDIRRLTRGRGLSYKVAVGLESRTLFAFNHLRAAGGMGWLARGYQVDSLESRRPRKVNCCARDVGKTSEIIVTACWASVCMPGGVGLVTAPLDNMLQPIMQEIRRQCDQSSGLHANLEGSAMSPAWRFRFKNGFVLHGRIGGLSGLNYKGIHADWVWVDEAQDMPQAAWRELYPAVKAGGKLWVYGVPNGIRGDFYRHTLDGDFEHQSWPMWLNPDVSSEHLERLSRVFGGVTSPAYLHNVAGQFSDTCTLAFPMDLVQKSTGPYALASYIAEADRFDDENIFKKPVGPCYMGVDLGFSEDPTEVTLFEEDLLGALHSVARAHIGHASYDKLATILATLISAWRPEAVGIDAGGPGLPVVHLLARLRVNATVYPVFFNAWVTWTPPELAGGVRGMLKNMVTDAMAAEMAAGSILFNPLDADRFEQYGAQTSYVSSSGRMAYSKGGDHIIDADRCAYYAARTDLFSLAAEPPIIGVGFATFGAVPSDFGSPWAIGEA